MILALLHLWNEGLGAWVAGFLIVLALLAYEGLVEDVRTVVRSLEGAAS